MPAFQAHDLLADFSELRRKLILVLQSESGLSQANLVDAFLLACGLNQVMEDYMGEGGARLTAAARVIRRAPRPLTLIARPLEATARSLQRYRDGGNLRDRQQELAELVDDLAGDIALARYRSRAAATTPRAHVARCLDRLSQLGVDVQMQVIRLPACFRSLDQVPEDFGRLMDRFAELQPLRSRPVLVIGLRTSGSYTAPLCAAYLRAGGYRRAECMTLRPRHPLLPTDVARIKAAAEASATFVLSDDPPNSGASLLAVAAQLQALGVDKDRIVIAVPLMDEESPASLDAYRHVVLPRSEWVIRERLEVAAVRESLSSVLTGRTITVGGSASATEVVVANVDSVARVPLPAMTDLKSGSPSRRHVRALFKVKLVDDHGGTHEHAIYAKGVGLGYLGDHSSAISRPLQEYLPAVYGVSDGLMFRAWLPDEWNLGNLEGGKSGNLASRIAGYVLARREALSTNRDISERLGSEGPLWKQTSQLLSGLFGKLRVPALSVTDQAAKRLLRSARPSVIDGSMAQGQWFAEPGAVSAGARKVDFDERAFSNQDFIIDQLYCYDAVYDLASAAADHDASAAERGEDESFVDTLKREYELASGARISEERWFLYQVMHTVTHQRFMSTLPGLDQAEERKQMLLKYRAGQRAKSRAAQRYYRARFFRDLRAPSPGAFCAIDVDGVLETDQMGFPATTPAGAQALRSLTAHGFRPVLVTGRSLDEVRERCRAYRLVGGVAEYGAVVYLREGDRAIHATASDAEARLAALRGLLAADPEIHLDDAYGAIVRAYRFEPGGRRRHLQPATLEPLRPDLHWLRLRQVDGEYQTDFVPLEVNKATGIHRLQRELDGEQPSKLALAIGDGPADLPAFAIAAKAFAPANAHGSIRGALRMMPNLRIVRHRAQSGLAMAASSVIGHRPGTCATCAPPRVDADGRLLLTVLSAQDGQKRHKLRAMLSAAMELWLPGPSKKAADGDNAVVAISHAAGLRLIRGDGLVGSSGLLFLGNLAARGVGLLFVVAAARFLGPVNYGLLAYALVIVNFGNILITNTPAGLSGFLARNSGNKREQDRYFSNWVLVVTTMVVISLVGIVPVSLVAGLGGWMLPALMANILGIAVFETYRASQRGLANFGRLTGFYVLANVLQLIAVLAAGSTGFRDPALFLAIYGLTNVATLIVMEIVAPTQLRFVIRSLRRSLASRIAIVSWPLLVQTAFFAIWFGSDLILVRMFLPPPLAGDYAASKALVNLIAVPAGAIGSAIVPHIARSSGPVFRRNLLRAIALTAAVVTPSLLILITLGGRIVRLIFGAKYPHAIDSLPLLSLGMSAYAFYVVFESVWVGLGRPAIDAIATGSGMLATITFGVVLVPSAGLAGAAASFALGAGVQLAIIGFFTFAAYLRSLHAGRPIGRTASLEVAPASDSRSA